MIKYRVGIVGSRNLENYKIFSSIVYDTIYHLLRKTNVDSMIISGDAKTGADRMAKDFADNNGFEYDGFPADWGNLNVPNVRVKVNQWGKEYNALAGFNRNTDIVENSDFLILFWDGESSGTEDTLEKTMAAKKPHLVIYH